MDDIRESFSEMKKRIKHRLTGKSRKADKAQASEGGVGVGNVEPSGSLPPQAVTSDDSEREGDEPSADDESARPGTAADESESDWKTTASASAKLLLRGVGSSSDAFGPLKSVAGGLCFILENCEVRLPPCVLSPKLMVLQRTKANKQSIESLAPKVKMLNERLCKPVPKSDLKERERRKRLER